jgi:hypothetical protein
VRSDQALVDLHGFDEIHLIARGVSPGYSQVSLRPSVARAFSRIQFRLPDTGGRAQPIVLHASAPVMAFGTAGNMASPR